MILNFAFPYRNTNIHYRKTGTGIPVVLLHGFGEDSHIWDLQAAFLEEHCQLIIPDIPGSGLSPALQETPPGKVSIDDYADCIHALLEHENIEQCIMLGHSMGGYITLAFAEKYASRLNKFGLIHATAFADSEEKKLNRTRGIELMQLYGGQQFLRTTIPNLFSAAFKKTSPQSVEALITAASSFSTPALQQYYEAMKNRPDRTWVLQSNLLPVLFVIGTEDVAAPLSDVIRQTHLPLKSYIHVLKGVGHMGMWEATEELNTALLAFIKS